MKHSAHREQRPQPVDPFAASPKDQPEPEWESRQCQGEGGKLDGVKSNERAAQGPKQRPKGLRLLLEATHQKKHPNLIESENRCQDCSKRRLERETKPRQTRDQIVDCTMV